MAFDREVPLTLAAAGVGAVEHGVVFLLEVGRAFERHRAANVFVGVFDLLLGKAQVRKQVEGGVGELFGRDLERAGQEVVADRPAVEDELDVEGGNQIASDFAEDFRREALGLEGRFVDAGGLLQAAVTDGVGFHFRDFVFAIAQRAECARNGLVDDLEVTATGELLELDEGEVGFDAGRVAVHDEADRAGGGDDGSLGVTEAVLLTKRDGLIPGALGGSDQALVGAAGVVERHRIDGDLFVAFGLAVGGAAVVADDAQHVAGVVGIAGECAEFGRHAGRRCVGDAGHDG